ncbi:MAG: AraC family transcriptional regulator [Bacteroidetes bacterium]|nr:MAG: AraC family transcriptional regulator [Bacteroidota bacterium]
MKQKNQHEIHSVPPTSAAHPGAVVKRNGRKSEDAFLKKFSRQILENLNDPFLGNEALPRAVAMSESQLNRKVKALSGQTLSLFIRGIRLQRARTLLQTKDMPVAEVAYETGFTDPANFSCTFSYEFGVAPSKFRR